MSRERLVSDIDGIARRDTIKSRIVSIANSLSDSGLPRSGFAQTLSIHFDDLGIDWNAPRTPGQINAIIPSIFSAFNLASYSMTGRFHTDSELRTPEQCWEAVHHVLADSDARDTFHESVWQLPVTFTPERVVPLHYITRHFFKEQPRPLVMVDLGAGPGYALPLLNSATEIPDDVINKGILQQMLDEGGQISIACGVSADKLPREEAILRAKANGYDSQHEQIDALFNELDYRKFPFVVTDLTETDASLSNIANELHRYGSDQADVVISSFVRYQLGSDDSTQNEFRRLSTMLTREGGIWIDIGDEMFQKDESKNFKVNVYQKQQDEMVYMGIPFVIEDLGTILEINPDFFHSRSRLRGGSPEQTFIS